VAAKLIKGVKKKHAEISRKNLVDNNIGGEEEEN
jgi:hypothetical protein